MNINCDKFDKNLDSNNYDCHFQGNYLIKDPSF